jgi:hypothetical protein
MLNSNSSEENLSLFKMTWQLVGLLIIGLFCHGINGQEIYQFRIDRPGSWTMHVYLGEKSTLEITGFSKEVIEMIEFDDVDLGYTNP